MDGYLSSTAVGFYDILGSKSIVGSLENAVCFVLTQSSGWRERWHWNRLMPQTEHLPFYVWTLRLITEVFTLYLYDASMGELLFGLQRISLKSRQRLSGIQKMLSFVLDVLLPSLVSHYALIDGTSQSIYQKCWRTLSKLAATLVLIDLVFVVRQVQGGYPGHSLASFLSGIGLSSLQPRSISLAWHLIQLISFLSLMYTMLMRLGENGVNDISVASSLLQLQGLTTLDPLAGTGDESETALLTGMQTLLASQAGNTTESPPCIPPPSLDTLGLEHHVLCHIQEGKCPLCLRAPPLRAAVSPSGIVGCRDCWNDAVTAHRVCPFTGQPLRISDIIVLHLDENL